MTLRFPALACSPKTIDWLCDGDAYAMDAATTERLRASGEAAAGVARTGRGMTAIGLTPDGAQKVTWQIEEENDD
jgi:hypothetical protein